MISEPGGKYMTHLTPPDGSGKTLAIELAAVIRERGIEAKVVGMDGCSVNTGVNNGAMRLLELDLGVPLQRVVCGLHLNELLWCITVQFGAPMVSGNYCVTGLLRILHSTVLYLALKKLSFGWKVLRYTVYLPTLYSALR